MDWLSMSEAAVAELLSFEIAGTPVLQIFKEDAQLLGMERWLAGAGSLELAVCQSAAIVLLGGLGARELYRRGHYLKALTTFMVSYEITWFVVVLLFAAADRLPMALLMLGMLGWNFFIVSCMGAMLIWRAGFGHLLVGVPGLTIRYLIKRGVIRDGTIA